MGDTKERTIEDILKALYSPLKPEEVYLLGGEEYFKVIVQGVLYPPSETARLELIFPGARENGWIDLERAIAYIPARGLGNQKRMILNDLEQIRKKEGEEALQAFQLIPQSVIYTWHGVVSTASDPLERPFFLMPKENVKHILHAYGFDTEWFDRARRAVPRTLLGQPVSARFDWNVHPAMSILHHEGDMYIPAIKEVKVHTARDGPIVDCDERRYYYPARNGMVSVEAEPLMEQGAAPPQRVELTLSFTIREESLVEDVTSFWEMFRKAFKQEPPRLEDLEPSWPEGKYLLTSQRFPMYRRRRKYE